jgi:hypothetical protein
VDHNPPPFPTNLTGRERLKRDFKLFADATPGYHHIEDQIAEGDKVVTRLTSYGKHEGDLPGAPRTGNEMKMTSIAIHRIAAGKLGRKVVREGHDRSPSADRGDAIHAREGMTIARSQPDKVWDDEEPRVRRGSSRMSTEGFL